MVRRPLALVLACLVAACGGGQTTPNSTPVPATSTSAQGRFLLTFTIDRTTVVPTDAVTGTASVTLLQPGSATITGSSTVILFEFQEVGGAGRVVIPARTAECAVQVVAEGGIVSPIVKSGAVPDGPDADWYRSEEHTSELQSRLQLGCRLLLGKNT